MSVLHVNTLLINFNAKYKYGLHKQYSVLWFYLGLFTGTSLLGGRVNDQLPSSK